MRILLIDNGTTLLAKLQQLIPGEEVVLQPKNIPASEFDDFDLIVLSGSKDLTVMYDSEHFKKETALIQNTQTPIIGICLGCELIVTAFGGTVKRLDERHSGIRKINIVSGNASLGVKDGDVREVYEGHHWIIDETPKDFEVIAVSQDGPEIIRHTTRPIYGFQFHPENLIDQTAGDEMFMNLFTKFTQK
ncbi:MAG: hypothetical protein A2937_02555 [Candidatus Yonathbacteria bacterium RIFCSPLOWO2_01_FULL_47_33b]|uniref:Glutamine amidotransferase domain-containing protein n=1 Tax=Candidatus Yonathbacteria bacterium RIFCSPLOWO2_01_FULL_47_33b TaxID=1802727 RepID=A0A1G2SI41_9BACT|nr:MAG: hypothetical protein A2937_02555 [Candidatus Yonathbacteria bacterium RIFCSPLOWO2_01_FULL_47_33b]